MYETPILKSRAPGCSEKDKELGEARMQQVRHDYETSEVASLTVLLQLMETAKSFVIRRDASILKSYLPPKRQ